MDVHLLDLPEHVLHDAFQYLDTWSLCQAAQTCRLFLRLAGSPRFWRNSEIWTEDKLMLAARLCLSRSLHLPPQIFAVTEDLSRSSKFPLAADFFNLRHILATPHLDEIVATACNGTSGQLDRAQHNSGLQASVELPAAIFRLVRPGKASIRFRLRPQAAVAAIMQGFQELGWPVNMGETETYRLPLPGCTVSARLGFQKVRAACGRRHASSQILHEEASAYRALSGAAQQCLKAANLEGQHLSALEAFLGEPCCLARHASKADLKLMLRLRRLLPDAQIRCVAADILWQPSSLPCLAFIGISHRELFQSKVLLKCEGQRRPDYCMTQAMMALSALRARRYSPRSKMMPSMGRVEPNSMAELVDCMQHALFLEALPFNVQSAGRQRLKARLHLKVLRFVHWCLFMFGADPIHAQVDHQMR